jgi:hypothetical protein
MKRPIAETEKIYDRVKDFIRAVPSEVLASLRVDMLRPKFIDHLRGSIKKDIGMTTISHKELKWCYSFWYGEKELYELIRQLS